MVTRKLVLIASIAIVASWPADRVDAQDAQDAQADPMYRAFERIVEDLNENRLDSFVFAVDKKAMLETIYDQRLIESRVRDQFSDAFAGQIETMFVGSFPPAEGEILGKIVAFERSGEKATAVVRFDLSPYQYLYHEFHLRAGAKDDVFIEDWIDFFRGERFTEAVGDQLVMVMPGGNQTRSLLSPLQLTEAETFQASELFKAIRDQKPDRYFEILPGLDDRIQEQEIVAVTSVHLAQQSRDKQQYRAALTNLAEHYSTDPKYTVMLLDYYLPKRDFQQALDAVLRLKDRLGTDDAAINAQLATLELILGNTSDAGGYAESAVSSEPGSELAWWAALRTRTAQEQYDAAVDALTVLEDEFGHKLRGKALERDAGLAKLLETDQYQTWLAAEKP